MSKEKDFFSTNEVEISVTMKGYEPMIFPMKEVLHEEAATLRQKHLGLSKDEQEKQQHSYNAKLLGMLVTAPPTNPLPGFPEMSTGDCGEVLTTFFLDTKDPVSGEKKRDFLTNLFGLYWRSIQPEEFFR